MANVKDVPVGQWTGLRQLPKGATYLYVVTEERGGPSKIGVSNNIFYRLPSLRGGNPRMIYLRHVWEVRDRQLALKLERAVLRHFAAFRLVGEWMDVLAADVVACVKGL